MKKILVLLVTLVSIKGFGQNSQAVVLKWKIDKNEKLSYQTVMSDIDEGSTEMNFDGFFKMFSDSLGKGLNENKDYFKKLNQLSTGYDYVTTLTNNDKGVVDIVMTSKPKDKAPETDNTASKEGLFKMMEEITQGVMLRGSVYETGGIHSFWVKTSQKNLLALLFELPARPVKIGDKWSLDVSLIENDQNFACDSSYKINEVTLTDIKKVNNETIAVLKYNIVEYVKGNFNAPAFFGNKGGPKETMMNLIHQGIAEFSIDKGRWIRYDALMSLRATGIMTANKKTKFGLINEKNSSK